MGTGGMHTCVQLDPFASDHNERNVASAELLDWLRLQPIPADDDGVDFPACLLRPSLCAVLVRARGAVHLQSDAERSSVLQPKMFRHLLQRLLGLHYTHKSADCMGDGSRLSNLVRANWVAAQLE